MPISPSDRRQRTSFIAGVVAVLFLFVIAFWHLLAKMDPAAYNGADWLFMPSVGMLGHLL